MKRNYQKQNHRIKPNISKARPEQFKYKANRLYLAFNKPYAVLSQFTKDVASVKATLKDFDFPAHVYPVGRLDFDSEGLLLLSDDSRLNGYLLDPIYGHERSYLVQVENIPSAASLSKLEKGVIIEGRKTRPCKVELLEDEPSLPERSMPIRFRKNIPTSWLKMTLSEGRNRQVRKMTASIGHPTLRIVRISIGQLSLNTLDLAPGSWCQLDEAELSKCFIQS